MKLKTQINPLKTYYNNRKLFNDDAIHTSFRNIPKLFVQRFAWAMFHFSKLIPAVLIHSSRMNEIIQLCFLSL